MELQTLQSARRRRSPELQGVTSVTPDTLWYLQGATQIPTILDEVAHNFVQPR